MMLVPATFSLSLSHSFCFSLFNCLIYHIIYQETQSELLLTCPTYHILSIPNGKCSIKIFSNANNSNDKYNGRVQSKQTPVLASDSSTMAIKHERKGLRCSSRGRVLATTSSPSMEEDIWATITDCEEGKL